MKQPSILLRRWWLEAATVLAALEGMLEIVLRRDAPNAPQSSLWLTVPAAALIVLPLLAHRLWPFAAPAAVWVLAAGFSFLEGRLAVFSSGLFAAGMAASFLLGNLPERTQARLGLLVVFGGAITVVSHAPGVTAVNYVFQPAMFIATWLVGLALQQRAARAEAAEMQAVRLARGREEATHAAIAAERRRIARELHDVLGHSVSVMTIQAAGVRRRLQPEQEKEREALLNVEQTGREALTEMRRLVGLLRLEEEAADFAPQPGLGQLARLVEQTREMGLAVELHVEGAPVALPPGVDLTAYRLVQEGLTNARKHSNAGRTDVRLRYEADAIEVEVCDNGQGSGAISDGGHGLIGMRERVSIYGGQFEAGPRQGGGFRLRARLPVPS